MARAIDNLRERLRSEQDGFTLVELLVAALIAGLAIMAVMGTLDRSGELIGSNERAETATQIAEQEIERIASLDYATVGTLSVPPESTDPRHPRFYVKDGGANYQWDTTAPASAPASKEQLVTGTLPPYLPLNSTWTDGRLSGEVWRFVTWIMDPNVVQTPTDQPDAKRVTVAVTVPGRRTKPVTLTSIVWDKTGP